MKDVGRPANRAWTLTAGLNRITYRLSILLGSSTARDPLTLANSLELLERRWKVLDFFTTSHEEFRGRQERTLKKNRCGQSNFTASRRNPKYVWIAEPLSFLTNRRSYRTLGTCGDPSTGRVSPLVGESGSLKSAVALC